MLLYRLLYQSEIVLSETVGSVDRQIDDIVAAAAQANLANDLSGALIASHGVFIQALEGQLAPLEAIFEKICSDLRHRRVRLIEMAAADERVFPEWKMVRVDTQDEVLRLCAGLGLEDAGHLDVSKTGAIINLMRSILVSKAMVADGTGFVKQERIKPMVDS